MKFKEIGMFYELILNKQYLVKLNNDYPWFITVARNGQYGFGLYEFCESAGEFIYQPLQDTKQVLELP